MVLLGGRTCGNVGKVGVATYFRSTVGVDGLNQVPGTFSVERTSGQAVEDVVRLGKFVSGLKR